MSTIPGWEGSIGPSPAQYGDLHVYARDVTSGAGNCVCGRDPGHRLHVQVGTAPEVQCPRCGTTIRSRLPDAEDAARVAELEIELARARARIRELGADLSLAKDALREHEATRTLGGPITGRRVPDDTWDNAPSAGPVQHDYSGSTDETGERS
jgi:hypothetical protein